MKKYWFIFRKHKVRLLILSLSIILSSVFQILITYIGGTYIDTISSAVTTKSIYLICLILMVLSFSNQIVRYILSYIMNPLIEKIVFGFEYYMLEHLKKISIIEYKKFNVAYLTKRIEEDSRQIAQFFVNNYTYFFVRGIEVLTIVIIVLRVNFILGIIMILICPIYLYVYVKFKKPIYEKNLATREKSAQYFQGFSNQLEYLEDIIIDANFETENNLLTERNQVYLQKFQEFINVNNKFTITQGMIVAIMQIFIYLIGGLSVFMGYTTIGRLTILITYFVQILTNITYYNDLAKTYQTTKAALARLNGLLEIPKVGEGNIQLNDVTSIKANIDFKIETSEILHHVNVEAYKGEVIGVVGKNGTGKTTLLKLLVGALKLNEEDTYSSIRYNDSADIRELDSVYLRKTLLAYIPQKIRLRDLTMKEILNEVETCDTSDDFIHVLQKNNIACSTQIASFIQSNWEKKMSSLSGGDKQFVDVLRNVVRQTGMMILDEPTSNLDVERIEWFNQLINSVKKDKIIFIITHDKQVYSVFDKVVNLESR